MTHEPRDSTLKVIAMLRSELEAAERALSTEQLAHGMTSSDLQSCERELAEERKELASLRRQLEGMDLALEAECNVLVEERKAREASPDDLREQGWAVAIHNDYRQDGISHTFWLLTKGDRAIRGEGRTDADALNNIRAVLGDAATPAPHPPPEQVCGICDREGIADGQKCPCCGLIAPHPPAPARYTASVHPYSPDAARVVIEVDDETYTFDTRRPDLLRQLVADANQGASYEQMRYIIHEGINLDTLPEALRQQVRQVMERHE